MTRSHHSITLPRDLADQAMREAKAGRGGLSGLVERALTQHLSRATTADTHYEIPAGAVLLLPAGELPPRPR